MDFFLPNESIIEASKKKERKKEKKRCRRKDASMFALTSQDQGGQQAGKKEENKPKMRSFKRLQFFKKHMISIYTKYIWGKVSLQ